MTATDELRRLLDERGVRHSDGFPYTTWLSSEGLMTAYENVADDTLMLSPFTPEQAIEATLGRGECEVVKGTGHGPTAGTKSSCSECGGVMNARDRYCRWCGRKVRA